MKAIFIGTLITALFISISFSAFAQTASPSAMPTKNLTPTTVEDKQVQDIKQKIANQVAALAKKDDTAVAGLVTIITGNTIKIKTRDDSEYDVKVDTNLTQFYKVSGTTKADMKFSDITKGDYLIVTGPVTDKSITPNDIYRDEEYFVKTGKVTDINTDDDMLTVVTSEKDTLTLDIVTTTTLQVLDSKTLAILTGTMSKIKEGDTIDFAYKLTGKETEANHFTVQRVLIIPQEYFVK